jgi:hypothetical protein
MSARGGKPRRGRVWGTAAGAVLLLAAGAAAWFWLRPPAPRAPRTGAVLRRVYVAPDTARIGEPVRVTFEVRTPAGHTVAFGGRPADDSLWTWQRWAAVPAEETAQGVRHRLRAEGLPFRTGKVSLPAPAFRLRPPGGKTTAGAFGRTSVLVRSVLPANDPRPDIHELKPPLGPPWWARVPWWLIGVALAAAALIWWWRRRRRPTPAQQQAAAAAAAAALVPAHSEALAALDALVAERLPEQGRWYEHQSRLTEIVRRFLERRFGSPQPGYTTRELCLHLAWRGVGTAEVERLRALLRVADLAKFARSDPGVETAHRHESETRALVLAWADAGSAAAASDTGAAAGAAPASTIQAQAG